jgi:hypothetical protein
LFCFDGGDDIYKKNIKNLAPRFVAVAQLAELDDWPTLVDFCVSGIYVCEVTI